MNRGRELGLDGARSARLLFVPEPTAGVVRNRELNTPEVRAATAVSGVPARPRRLAQQLSYKLGRLSFEEDVLAPLTAARRSVLGERAPPRFLVRVDEFPHYRAWDDPARYGTQAFERFHEIMDGAGVPYLLAVLPRVSREPLSTEDFGSRPLEDGERSMLARLAGESEAAERSTGRKEPVERLGGRKEAVERSTGRKEPVERTAGTHVSFALHGLTHRTRFASPRRHSELCGLSAEATDALLDAGLSELAAHGVCPEVFVAPYNRFDAAQLPALARRFQVVCGGPESIGCVGFQPTPQWRGETVYLPSYAPFYGHAAEVLPAVERAVDAGSGLWIPVVLHWGWEADAGWRALERLALALAPHAARWEDFLDAARRSRDGSQEDPVAGGSEPSGGSGGDALPTGSPRTPSRTNVVEP
jgi:hypothetical protein